MMRSNLIITMVMILMTPHLSSAQEVYKIWEGEEVPFYKENDLKEYEESPWDSICVYNVTRPTPPAFLVHAYDDDPVLYHRRRGIWAHQL